METADIGSFDLISLLTDDICCKPFTVPDSMAENIKNVYPYLKLCGYGPFVSIIGSFSAGKSSFINTLSAKDITTCDTSKTTSIPMFIKHGQDNITINTTYSKTIGLEIDYLDKIIEHVRHNPDIDYRRYIDFMVLDYDGFPYKNVALIDTPGYSGGDEDYEVSRSMTDISDGIIFMFDASRGALTSDDLKIIEYAKNKNIDILIIANKIDKVWDSKEEIMKNARNSLQDSGININNKNICYFSNDPDYVKQISLEFMIVKNFIETVSKKEPKLIEYSGDYWYEKGNALYNLKRYDEAFTCFDKATGIEPDNADYWNDKGLALYRLSRYNEAFTCFDKATEIEPDNDGYWNMKGIALDELKRYGEAVIYYDRATGLNPNNAVYWGNKGNALYRLSRYNEAFTCFDKATGIEPDNDGYWNMKGIALDELKRYGEAVIYYDRATGLNPNNAVYWGNKGNALYRLSRYDEAVRCYDKATGIEPDNADYWNDKGNALYNLSRYDEAVRCYDRATGLNPNNAVYWGNKGSTLNKLKRNDEAKKCFQRAKELGYNG